MNNLLRDTPDWLKQQAIEYVNRVGPKEAKNSNHYLTALRHCRCKQCFCCLVLAEVNRQLKTP